MDCDGPETHGQAAADGVNLTAGLLQEDWDYGAGRRLLTVADDALRLFVQDAGGHQVQLVLIALQIVDCVASVGASLHV